jgi:2'-5' RNA ligase
VTNVRYAVYLRPSSALADAVADVHDTLKRGWGLTAAGRFTPHVTLKGFFLTDATTTELRLRLVEALSACRRVVLHNAGVKTFATDAIVLDVDKDDTGQRNRSLHVLHEAAFDAVAPIVSPHCEFTPREHALDAFSAHVTLAMADIPARQFADVLAFVRATQPIGARMSEASEVRLMAFRSADWTAAWWRTLIWRPVASCRLGDPTT